MLWTFEILWIYLLLERSDENMKKKIAIMLTLILATGTFTACTTGEKVNNSSLSPTASTSVGVSASGGSSEMATPETMQSTEKATVSKETEPSEQNTKTEKKSRQWAKFGGCFSNESDSENTIRGSEYQQEYSEQ